MENLAHLSREDFVAWYFKATANLARMSNEERGQVCSSVMKIMYFTILQLMNEKGKTP